MMISKIKYSIITLILFSLSLSGCKEDNDVIYLSLNLTERPIDIQESFRFIAKVQGPNKDYNEKVTWSIIDMKDLDGNATNVATIDQNGTVTGLALGTAKVKAEIAGGQYALAHIIVQERRAPEDGMEFAKADFYMTIDGTDPDTLELLVDKKITQHFELKLSSNDERIIKPELLPGKDEETYKIALRRGGSEGTAVITAAAGKYTVTAKVHVGVKLYLSFDGINTSLGEPSITALNSFTFNVGTTGVIPIYFRAIPDDKEHLDNIDFYVSVTGKSVLKKVSQRIEGSMLYLDVEVGKDKGDAVITVEALGNKVTAECTVMDRNDINVASIEFAKNSKEVKTSLKNIALYESVKITPLAAAALWPPTWKSSDESIATVDENGTAFFKKRGEVVITATSKDKSDYCTITALLDIAVLSFDSNLKTELFPTETTQWTTRLSANYDDRTGVELMWDSSDKSIATVNNQGGISAISAGKTTISVQVTDDLGKTKRVEKILTVEDESNVHIYDLNFDRKEFNYIVNDASIDVFDPQLPSDDPHYYSFHFVNMSGQPIILEGGHTYQVGTQISTQSYTQFWEFGGEKANIQSGTLKVTGDTLIFDLTAKAGTKNITIKGTVLLSEE